MRLILLFAAFAAAMSARSLEIFFIDVEGGQSTLIVAPSGQSLLIDAGYADYSGRDADRIADAAKAARIKRIDAVLITHHHSDHEGGVPNLLQRLDVGEFFDPGPSVETSPDQLRAYKAYEQAVANRHRIVVKPGDMIPLKGLTVTVVAAAGARIDKHGEANPFCEGIIPEQNELAENARSAGVVIEYGKFRFADLGDLTPNKETALLCPENRVGNLDLFLTDHHGGVTSKAIYGMAPRVAIMNNGPRKGADPQGWKTVKASPGLEDLWQLHYAAANGEAANVPDTFIANLEEHCSGNYLKVTAEPNGAFTVYNPRNKFSKKYGPK
ncbi:MAG TPA: MBL fold metallo-hydrolase [Bryobacteraceae bacterium]|jgi:competence protein ComEC|nr:MBL fold metallo-hydrolase [Bryobacteraceae bacterium]